jgi:hypothetical protein
MERDLRWASARYMDLVEANSVHSEEDHQNLFDKLKWG